MTASLTAITMPKWGLTMTEGKVVRWAHAAGDSFSAGDELLEIETTKVANVVEAEGDATVLRIVAAEGATLPIGALLAVIGPADTPAAKVDAFVAGFKAPEPAEVTGAEADTPSPKSVDAGGRQLQYLEIGEGEPLVLVHGFGGDLNNWMFVQPTLAEKCRTIALDLPGHGGSAKDAGAGDAESLAGAVAAALDALGIKGAHLAGHSMGGTIAVLVAARRPDLVSALTLIAPAGLGAEINGAFIAGFVRMQRRKEAQETLSLLVHDPALVSRRMIEDVLRYKRLDGVEAALQTIARAWFDGDRQRVNVREQLASLRIPVRIIWGKDDRIIPASHAQGMSDVHVLDAAGHLPHLEKAGEVLRVMK
ncbi:MAG TPA: acetoin dehydrogenase dihydrolipoyllysine-residue acetyltransferase subunit [Acetobacteraceae bacterium]|jgi:pyruvate dehydrogenase E2 component (dihydrolipoamide acetyltransferase)|nr:acetoin dehydrogenase dihydrolipoyllysine-residue acetyltransferase subunit [Acetobacteraceae bacterium]